MGKKLEVMEDNWDGEENECCIHHAIVELRQSNNRSERHVIGNVVVIIR